MPGFLNYSPGEHRFRRGLDWEPGRGFHQRPAGGEPRGRISVGVAVWGRRMRFYVAPNIRESREVGRQMASRRPGEVVFCRIVSVRLFFAFQTVRKPVFGSSGTDSIVFSRFFSRFSKILSRALSNAANLRNKWPRGDAHFKNQAEVGATGRARVGVPRD